MQALLWPSCGSSCVGLFLAVSKNSQQTPTVDVPHVREGILIRRWSDFQNVFSGLHFFSVFQSLVWGPSLPFHNLLMKSSRSQFLSVLEDFYVSMHTCVKLLSGT